MSSICRFKHTVCGFDQHIPPLGLKAINARMMKMAHPHIKPMRNTIKHCNIQVLAFTRRCALL
jgi:hypothetical protein